MKKSTVKTIIILVGLLFINIEAAQAGLVTKLKLYIRHEFSSFEFYYYAVILIAMGFLTYVIVTPVVIGKQKSVWLNYYSYSTGRYNYQNKRNAVKRISQILNNNSNQA